MPTNQTVEVEIETHGTRKAGAYRAWLVARSAGAVLRTAGFELFSYHGPHALVLPKRWGDFELAVSKTAPEPPATIKVPVQIPHEGEALEVLKSMAEAEGRPGRYSEVIGSHGSIARGFEFRPCPEGRGVFYVAAGGLYRRLFLDGAESA